MASSMSSTFTTGERKKKVITYGKLSRPPPPRPSIIDDDAPSPERPHKQAATFKETPTAPPRRREPAKCATNARVAAPNRDEFDVPSEDEFEIHPTTPAKKSIVQHSKTDGGPRASAIKSAGGTSGYTAASTARPLQKPVVTRTVKPKTVPLQNQAESRQPAQGKDNRHVNPHTHTVMQTKASRATDNQEQTATTGPRLQRSNTSSKDTSRASTPGILPQPVSKPQSANLASTARSGKIGKSATKPLRDVDVFDLPSDDEEVSIPIPRAPSQTPRQASRVGEKPVKISRVMSQDTSRKIPNKSTDLGSLQNRKRKGSVSLTTAHQSVAARSRETSNQQRDRKVVKREEGSSPRGEATVLLPRSTSEVAAAEATVNKARRTRTHTIPVVNQPTMSKGQSSPAVLNRMLPNEQPSRALREDTAFEVPASDDTMYDIAETTRTPARPTPLRGTTSSTPGSVTPRQKDLFSTLLGVSAAPKTPASALASLQLTDRKPRSLLGALARSKSDVSLSGMSRKTRLLDTLKDKDVSSEEDDSESDDDVNDSAFQEEGIDNDRTPVQVNRSIKLKGNDSDHVVNENAATDSQSPQLAPGAATRPKLTYASQRSYLQEANNEDEFLMSMDLDDGWKMDSQTVSTDDEDGPTSQPRTHHELKKYGQNTMFSWDMEESIHEISDASNKSMRRSAMMDVCTKMADAGFVSQLLDSGFMHKLLENMTSSDDVVFDFIAGVSVLFALHTRPAFAIVDQIYRSGVTTMLIGLVDKDIDISRIARDRKSNMSKIAQESLIELRALLLESKAWSSSTTEKVSPQLLALETIDSLTRSLRESGSTEALLSPIHVSRIVNVASMLSKRVEASNSSAQNLVILDLTISILETVSIADSDHSTWPPKVLQQLSEAIPVFFRNDALSKTVEVMKLSMHLTNNKPKSCQPFSTQAFVGPLVSFIVTRFDRLGAGELDAGRRTHVLADLTLGLGTMINLAELNDQARLNAVQDSSLVEVLVKTFVTGSKRAAEASSVEESEVGVVIGFLAVLLGMLCLNTGVRSQIQTQLPDRRLHILLENMKQFARIHDHVDKRTASRFEGTEGKEALNGYYIRIMHVVKKLESVKA